MFRYSRSKQKKAEPAAETIRDGLRWLTDYFICAYIVFIVGVLPFYSEQGYSYIATEKSLFFRRISLYTGGILAPLLLLYLAFSLYVYCRQAQKRKTGSLKEIISRHFTLTDCFAVWYAAALTVSYICSDYRENARWGAEGWYMGFYTQLILLCAYFLISRLWKPRKEFFYLMLAASGAVFLLGILNRFDIYPIKMERANAGFISTIGNINWYCGYAVTVFFWGAALQWQGAGEKKWQKFLLAVYAALGFATLVTQGSASGIMTLGVLMLAMFFLSAKEGKRMTRFWLLMWLLSAACLLVAAARQLFPERLNYQDVLMNLLTTGRLPIIMTIVSCLALWLAAKVTKKNAYPEKAAENIARGIMILVSCSLLAYLIMLTVNTLFPGSLGGLSQYGIFTFSGKWGSNRGDTWRAGVRCFSEQTLLHKLVGVGPDAMAAYLYQDGSEELVRAVRETFDSSVLTNVHNEWLTVLVDTGILGLAGFGGMMLSAMRTFIKKLWKSPIAGACGMSLLAYTVNNIFSFQQVMNVTTVFVILGMGMAFHKNS